MNSPVQQFRTKAEQAYLDMFVAAEKALPGARNNWVSGLRTKAIGAYGRLGLPHRRIEAWKYTDLRARLTDVNPLLKAEGIAVSEADLARALGSEIASSTGLSAGRGRRRSQGRPVRHRGPEGGRRRGRSRSARRSRSPPSWLKAALAQVNPREDDAVVALNTALMTGGAALRIGAGVTLGQADSSHPARRQGRACLDRHAERGDRRAGSSATLIESFASLGISAACSAMRRPSSESARRRRFGM